MYKAVIFDFFGVIRSDQYNAWLKHSGYTRIGEFAKASQDMDNGKISIDEFLERLSTLSGQDIEATTSQFYSSATVDQEVVELIKILRKNKYTIALLSNSASAHLRGILQEHNFESLFDEIVISGEVGFSKPSKKIFDYTVEKMRLNPSEVIFVDDNPANINAAKQFGIQSLLFKDSTSLKEQLVSLGIDSD